MVVLSFHLMYYIERRNQITGSKDIWHWICSCFLKSATCIKWHFRPKVCPTFIVSLFFIELVWITENIDKRRISMSFDPFKTSFFFFRKEKNFWIHFLTVKPASFKHFFTMRTQRFSAPCSIPTCRVAAGVLRSLSTIFVVSVSSLVDILCNSNKFNEE